MTANTPSCAPSIGVKLSRLVGQQGRVAVFLGGNYIGDPDVEDGVSTVEGNAYTVMVGVEVRLWQAKRYGP